MTPGSRFPIERARSASRCTTDVLATPPARHYGALYHSLYFEGCCLATCVETLLEEAAAVQAAKFAMFAGSNVVETLSSTALGMAVGAVAPSTDVALVLGPAIVLIFVVFGGLYTNQSDVPCWLRWVPNTSAIKAGYDALCKNEFTGLELEGDGVGAARTGEEVLERQGFSGTAAGSLAHQGRILAFYWWLTFCILRADKPRFQPMLPPAAAAEVAV